MAPRCAPIPLPHPPGRRPAGGVRPTPRTARQVKVRRVGAVRRRGLRSSRPGRTFHRPPDESRGRLQSHAPTSPRLPVPAPIRVHGSPDSSDRLSAFRPCVRPDHDHHQLITITITKTHPPNPHRFVGVRCSPTGCGKGCGGGGRGGMAKKIQATGTLSSGTVTSRVAPGALLVFFVGGGRPAVEEFRCLLSALAGAHRHAPVCHTRRALGCVPPPPQSHC
jgi:hypothetical protein